MLHSLSDEGERSQKLLLSRLLALFLLLLSGLSPSVIWFLFCAVGRQRCVGAAALPGPVPLPHRHRPRVQQPSKHSQQSSHPQLDGHHRQHQPVSGGPRRQRSAVSPSMPDSHLNLESWEHWCSASSTHQASQECWFGDQLVPPSLVAEPDCLELNHYYFHIFPFQLNR